MLHCDLVGGENYLRGITSHGISNRVTNRFPESESML